MHYLNVAAAEVADRLLPNRAPFMRIILTRSSLANRVGQAIGGLAESPRRMVA